MKKLSVFCLVLLACCGCGRSGKLARRQMRVFHAAAFTPAVAALQDAAERELGVKLLAESSGSITACRKLTELGRKCDLLVLADSALVSALLPGVCAWRLDFADDEMVLAVGTLAPMVEKAETDWPSVLTAGGVRFMRTDENQSPVGYRTLIILKFIEQQGRPGFYEEALRRCERVFDDVGRLAPLLKTGEADYAFLNKSLCVASDIRFIELPPEINMADSDRDYSSTCVSFEALKAGERTAVTVCGAPATWSFAIPAGAENPSDASKFIEYVCARKSELLASLGFEPVQPPHFYGSETDYGPFSGFAEYKGALTH